MSGHHSFSDSHCQSNVLVALDGRVKLTLLVAALSLNLVAGGLRVPPLLAALTFILTLLASVRATVFLRRMVIPLLLALVACVTQFFWVKSGAVVAEIPLAVTTLTIHSGALLRGLELAGRILGGMGVLLFFSLTTPLPELMRAARFFRCPPVLVELALIMYRYIFLLLEEGERIRNAERARLGFVDFKCSLRSSGILGGMLVLRTYDRAERSFAAMRCRGYRGVLTPTPAGPLHRSDWFGLLIGLLLLAGLLLVR
jgi:cobalt/nickel transport system permease protein